MQYTIKRGDTLSQLAERFGVSQVEIVYLNNIKDPDKIYAGQVISIPSLGPLASAVKWWWRKVTNR